MASTIRSQGIGSFLACALLLVALSCVDGGNVMPMSAEPSSGETRQSGSPNFLFHSDWSTATGTSSEALLDTSKDKPWDFEKGDRNGGAAVTDTVPWPDGITNGLTIRHVDGNDNPGVRLTPESLPPFTSGKRGFRAYVRMVVPADETFDGCCHPFQDGAGGVNTNWQFYNNFSRSGEWQPAWAYIQGTCGGCGGAHYKQFTIGGEPLTDPSNYVPNGTYRIEMLMTHHPTADSVHMQFRLYDENGELVAGEDDFKRVVDDQPSSVVTWYPLELRESTTQLQIGTNGWSQQTAGRSHVKWHWAAVAVCDDWCGPYDGAR